MTVARWERHKVSGTVRAHLKLTPAGRAALDREGSLAVVVRGVAIDRSGNMTTADHGRTLAP